MAILDNLENFNCMLAAACEKYGRNIEDVRVMAVSKTRSVNEIREAHQAGLVLFGENRVEEADEKFSGLPANNFPLVLIGHLQSNKVFRIGKRFKAVHSVDSIKLARRLSRHRESIHTPLEVLLQVNTSGEATKSGFQDKHEFLEAAAEITTLPFLELRGVMTMAPFVNDEASVRRCFALCHAWGEDVRPWLHASSSNSMILSMGMSSDFQWAVAEGSTLLRIGTTIFGVRH